MNLEIDGKVAWVVGASGAIGSAIAKALAAEGAIVVASGRNAAVLKKLVDDISRSGGKARAVEVDVSNAKSVERAAIEAAVVDGRIDILVNATAAPLFGEFLSLDDDAWLTILNSKLLAYVRTMRAVIPVMQKNGGGSIVNVSGRGGRQPTATHLAGGSANAGINLLTKGIADRFRGDNIRANTVVPGPIKSGRAALVVTSNAAVATSPVGQPEDVAETVAWLASKRSAHITGSMVAIDGGGTAAI